MRETPEPSAPVSAEASDLEILLFDMGVKEDDGRILSSGEVEITLTQGKTRLTRDELEGAWVNEIHWDEHVLPEGFVKAVRQSAKLQKPSPHRCLAGLKRTSVLCDFVCHTVAICHDPLPSDPPNQDELCEEIQLQAMDRLDRLKSDRLQRRCRSLMFDSVNRRRLCRACNRHPKFK